MADRRWILAAPALLPVLLSSAFAQDASPGSPAAALVTLPTIDVVAATPLLGSGVDRSKVPAQTQVLTQQDITRDGNADALRALNEQVPGVTLDAAAGNPFQPSLFYHGFQASPLQGNPQGLAVYINGARFNQPFGDTVDWDLIPDLAIERMNLVGSNPVFGLNALGGALSVQMKNGFTYHGTEIDALGGSFAKYQGELQYGIQVGDTAAYLAASGVNEGGWRDLQSSDLGNLFGDIGWQGNRGQVHVNIIAAQTRLNGPGTSPVQLLAVDPAAQFTAPNLITNQYTQVNLTSSYQISGNTSLQGNLYSEYLLQKVVNGNVADATPCSDGSGFLCTSPGVYATDRNGNPIPDFLNGGPYSDLDQQSTNTYGYGGALQVTNRTPLFAHPNQFIAGISFDGGKTLFGPALKSAACRSRIGYSPVPASPSIRRTALSRRSEWRFPTLITGRSLPTLMTSPRCCRPISRAGTISHRLISATSSDWVKRRSHLWPLQPVGRPDLENAAQSQRLCKLCRGQPRADAGRADLRQRRQSMQPRQFLCRRPEFAAGGGAHG